MQPLAVGVLAVPARQLPAAGDSATMNNLFLPSLLPADAAGNRR